MASLLTDLQKNRSSQLMDDLHDTFSQQISIISEIANASVIDDGSFNSMSDRKDSNITYSAIETLIQARVKWLDKAESEAELGLVGDGHKSRATIPLIQNYGIVRIKVKSDFISLINNATKIIVDGQDCQMFLNYSPQNLFSTNYAVFYLTRQN